MQMRGDDYAEGYRKLPGRNAARFMALIATLFQKTTVGNPLNQITRYKLENGETTCCR